MSDATQVEPVSTPNRRRFLLAFIPIVALGGLAAARQRQLQREQRRQAEAERKERMRRQRASPEDNADDE